MTKLVDRPAMLQFRTYRKRLARVRLQEAREAERQTSNVCIRAERVEANGGATTGFRLELTNPAKDEELALPPPQDADARFDIRLVDTDGMDVSPVPAQQIRKR